MKKNLLIGAALAGTLIAAAGCKPRTTVAPVAAVETKPLVSTTVARTEPIPQTVEFTSSIEPFKQNYINPSMQVRIDRILVDVGDRVRRGQLLVVMDQTQLGQLELQVANLQADYDRMKAVYDAGGISKQQIDQLKTSLEVQTKSLANIRANLELRSPIDGVVTARYFDPGDVFGMGNPGILQLMQIDPLKVSVALSEQYFTRIATGMAAGVTVETLGDEVFPGKVSLIAPAIDPATRTFTVEITIPNHGNKLRPGMYSRTTLDFGTVDGVTVDDLAVQKQYGTNEKFIYVVNDGRAVRRTVELGRLTGNRQNILSGVARGEEVVVSGFSRLNDGVEVEVQN